MAWTVDSNFGSTFVADSAFAPFDTSPGNNILNFGAGAVYRDDIDEADIQLEMDILCTSRSRPPSFNTADSTVHFVGRRQADGSFYTGGVVFYGNGSGSRRWHTTIHHYDGPGDTFTLLADTDINFVSNLLTPDAFDLVKFRFVISGNSLSTQLLNSSGVVVMSLGIIDNAIESSGNPGLAANLISINEERAVMFGDNLQVDSI